MLKILRKRVGGRDSASPKGVLMLCPDFGYGGAERSFAKTALLLSEFCDVTCVAFNGSIERFYEVGGRIDFLDVRTSRFSVVRFLMRIWRLREIVRRQNVEVSLSFLEGADYINFFSGAPRRVASIRGSKTADIEIVGLKGALRRTLMRFIYPRMDCIVPVSCGLGREMTSVFGVPVNKVSPIANFYNLDEIIEQADAPLEGSVATAFAENDVWCHVGRLHPGKNQAFLIRLLQRRLQKFPRTKLALIGDGVELKVLQALCEELELRYSNIEDGRINVQADVWFFGYQRNPHALVSKGRLLLFPSLYEGFPNALVEAMVCGVPAIAADCIAGPSEILDVELGGAAFRAGQGGVLVAVPVNGDEDDLLNWEQAIEQALSQHSVLSSLARVRASVFSVDAARQRWRNLIIGPIAEMGVK